MVGFVLCGVQVILLPDTQYEYAASLSSVTVLPEALYLPLAAASWFITPAQPACWMVAAQVHPPVLVSSTQLIEAKKGAMTSPMREHSTLVPESIWQSDGKLITSLPDVVVLSVYFPVEESAVHVPVTWRDPVIDATWQPRPQSDMSG
jgi:hypothetical protein